jgi:outer membrane PBP1 activator LpoA protein
MQKTLSALMLAGLLSACGTYAPEGSPPEYAQGYNNGCMNAYVQGGRQTGPAPPRDERLYASSTQYQAGWQAGFQKCFDRALTYGGGMAGGR